jgi:membrane protease YdiL (CAAX protease family)
MVETRERANVARNWFLLTAGILAAFNVARGLAAFGPHPVFAALGLTIVIAALAWRSPFTLADLGLARADLRRGALVGVAAFGAVTLVLVLVAIIPATRGYLDDSRADVSGPSAIYEVVVAILIATVVPEELAFRGLLLASARGVWDDRRAALASSVVFGLWHISPTLRTMSHNSQLGDATNNAGGETLVVLGAVLTTFVAGVGFCWLRLRSRSLLAPVLAHLATNAVAFALAWIIVR